MFETSGSEVRKKWDKMVKGPLFNMWY